MTDLQGNLIAGGVWGILVAVVQLSYWAGEFVRAYKSKEPPCSD